MFQLSNFLFRCTFLMLVAAMTMTSCLNGTMSEGKETTYTFKYNVDAVSGVSVDATVFEYNSNGEKVGSQTFKCTKGLKQVINPSPKATKVKVRLTVKAGTNNSVRWVREVFHLRDGKNIDVEVIGSTIIVEKEP